MRTAHPTPHLRKDGHTEREEHISAALNQIKGELKPIGLLLKTQHFPFVPRTFQNILEVCKIHQNPRGAQLFVKFLYIFKSIAVTVKAPKHSNSMNQKPTRPCTTDPWNRKRIRIGQKDIFFLLAFHSSPTNPFFHIQMPAIMQKRNIYASFQRRTFS